MFNIPSNQVKVIFITNSATEDAFLSFLFNETQYSWFEREYDHVASRLETIGTLLIRDDDVRLENLFKRFYETAGIIYYFVGTKYLCTTTTIDPFIHGIYVSKDQWKEFNSLYKHMHGLSFNDHIKEIK